MSAPDHPGLKRKKDVVDVSMFRNHLAPMFSVNVVKIKNHF